MPTKLSGNLVAVDATRYQILRAAANDSKSHWERAEEYKRELLASRRSNRALWVLLGIASSAAIVLGVWR